MYSTTISAFLTGHLGPLIEWVILCTGVIVVPIVYWTPFDSEEKAEQIALAYIRARHAEARPIRDTTLKGWKWDVPFAYLRYSITDTIEVWSRPCVLRRPFGDLFVLFHD